MAMKHGGRGPGHLSRWTKAAGVTPAPTPAPTPPLVAPGGSWNGTAGTGYGGAVPTQTGTAVPCQPWRGNMHGGLAPNLNFVFTEDFYPECLFTDDLLVLVDGEELQLVTAKVEGTSQALTRVQCPVPICTGPAAYGTTQGSLWGFYIDWSACALDGALDLYVDGVSTRGGVWTTRTIGPLRVFRRTDSGNGFHGYDARRTIGSAGADYTTVQAALAAHATIWTSGQCLLLECITDVSIDPAALAFTSVNAATRAKRGHVKVMAGAHTVVAQRASGNANTFRPTFSSLVFDGVRFDMANMTQVYQEDGAGVGTNDGFRPLVLRRCEFTSSNGQFEAGAASSAYTNAQVKTPRATNVAGTTNGPVTRMEIAFLSCYIHEFNPGAGGWGVMIANGNYISKISGDFALIGDNLARNAVISFNTHVDCSAGPYRDGTPAISLYRTGGNGGVRYTGNANTSARKLILTVSGSDVDSGVTISVTPGSGIYTCADLVSHINTTYGGTGWVATLINDDWRAAAIGYELAAAGPIIPVGSSSGTATVQNTYFWLHVDFVQFQTGQDQDCHLITHNRVYGADAQIFFPSIQTTSKSSWNCLIKNNVGSLVLGHEVGSASQVGGDHFNLGIVHNTLPNQRFLVQTNGFDTDIDATCYFQNNVFLTLEQASTVAGGVTMLAVVENNFAIDAASFPLSGANVSNNNVGTSDVTDEFPNIWDAPATLTLAKFTPASGGQIRAFDNAPVVAEDITGTTRANPDWSGAISLAA